jgi:large subunit ribosomal protein L35Ae
MKAKIRYFRQGRTTQKPRHFIIDANLKDRKEALSFIGKIVEWKSPSGKILKGKITSAHGNKGLIRAVFEKGLPGQAINEYCEIK